MREDILIRRQEPEDYVAAQALFEQPNVIEGTLQMPFPSKAMWRARLAEVGPEHDYRMVAVSGEAIVGSAGIHPNARPRRRHTASVGMAVHDDWQGQGIGRGLMNALLDVADNWLQIRRVELTVFTDNSRAIGLYRSVGFVEEGVHREFAFRNGEYVDALAMARVRG